MRRCHNVRRCLRARERTLIVASLPFLSLIIPVRNDAAALACLIAQIEGVTRSIRQRDAIEVVIACATPVDERTAALRRQHSDLHWVEAQGGRGTQLNAGAAVARGDWLWFVHADSRLPDGWLPAMRNFADSSSEVVGGAFRFALDSGTWQARLLERAVAARVRLFDLPYGDQGLFVRRSVFAELGGFQPIPLMEDVDFVRRLKRVGRLRHLTLSLRTSARRWEREGWLRTSASNLLTLALYAAGVAPERLARRYYGRRRNLTAQSERQPRQ
jgi:rSAM/selenodomain-associated transferase 2